MVCKGFWKVILIYGEVACGFPIKLKWCGDVRSHKILVKLKFKGD